MTAPPRVLLDLHALGEDRSGNETYAANLAREVVERGGDALRFHLAFGRRDDLERFEEETRLAAGRDFDAAILGTRRSSRRWLWDLPRLLARGGFDVAHFQYVLPARIPAGTRRVVTVHDVSYRVFPEHFTARQRVIHRAIDGSVARADRVLTISEFTRGELRRTYPRLAPGRVVNAGAGVDRRVFRRDPRARATLEELERRRDFRLPDRFVLAAGNLQPRKNLPRLLEAFARVRGSDPSLGLVVAGRETGRDPGLRRALAADAAVTWTDWVSRPELVALYSACRLFVYPSLYEGFGLPVLEAMACGAPVITSRGSAPEEVCPVPDALFDPRSVQDIAARMERSLTDDAAARLRAEQAGLPARHSWAAVADRTLDVYRSVEDGRQSSSDAFTSASSSSISSAK